MREAEADCRKRRRMSPGGNSENSLSVCDLPDNILADVATHLPRPSRALFAAAMTAPHLSWQRLRWKGQSSSASKAIISSSNWEILDFADIEESLASKLTDGDIGSILVCIDAVHNLEKLKLAGCVKITGYGLQPLRRSSLMRQIDLSIAREHQSSVIDPEPWIIEQDVLPTLERIVDAHQNSFRYLQLSFPKKWRENKSAALGQFLQKYHKHMEGRGLCCSKCKRLIEANSFGWNTCYNCINLFCYDCHDENDQDYLNFCQKCERDYCLDCYKTGQCEHCFREFCTGCESLKGCQNCGHMYCQDCDLMNKCACWDTECCIKCNNAPWYTHCQNDGCNRSHCCNCSGSDDPTVDMCEYCKRVFCEECRVVECRKNNWNGSCSGCLDLIAKTIPRQAKEIEKLHREIDDLKKNQLQL